MKRTEYHGHGVPRYHLLLRYIAGIIPKQGTEEVIVVYLSLFSVINNIEIFVKVS